jgi:hypothetical protein
VPVRYVPALDAQLNPFTPPSDVQTKTTIKGSGPFGGTGSNYVCDRELLIRYLLARPDRMRAWARVHALPPTEAAVSRFIRSLRPSTLVRPTRVTNYFYSNGRAVPFQAILAPGTAVLVDRQGAIRARCRCGNPLLDPILTANERCDGCPASVRPSTTWQLSSTYYVVHPAPPPVKGEKPRHVKAGPLTVRVVRVVAGSSVIEETYIGPDGKTQTQLVTIPQPPVQTVTRTLPRVTITDTKVLTTTTTITIPSTVNVPQTVTVYTGGG